MGLFDLISDACSTIADAASTVAEAVGDAASASVDIVSDVLRALLHKDFITI